MIIIFLERFYSPCVCLKQADQPLTSRPAKPGDFLLIWNQENITSASNTLSVALQCTTIMYYDNILQLC